MTTPSLRWRKSTYQRRAGRHVSSWRRPTGRVYLRNSNHPDAGTLALAPDAMAAWVATVAAGDLDDLAL